MIERVIFLAAGHCHHPECMVIKGGSIKPMRFPALVVAFVHSRLGTILFDTGYAAHFAAATRRFPERFYAMITPVTATAETSALAQLAQRGIGENDVTKIILSHFHADHVAGLRDFPGAQILFRDTAYESVRQLRGYGAVRRGYLPQLLPDDFPSRARAIAASTAKAGLTPYAELSSTYDLLGDGSLVGVDLPGHAPGHMGVYADTADGPLLLIGDAVWLARNYIENKPPSRLARWFMADYPAYIRTAETLHLLHERRPELRIVPCHCETTLADLGIGAS